MNDAAYMRLAIAKAREGIDRGQTPFGTCIVREGEVLSACHNEVWARTDSTAHAEILAIREACRRLGRIDLSGCVLYTTCEPCPMCFSAAHWARVDRIRHGATIQDAQAAGFHELTLSSRQMKELGASPVEIEGGLLREDCSQLFQIWLEKKLSRPY